MRLRILVLWLFAGLALHAQTAVPRTVLIIPFENISTAPGIEWIGESFPIVLGQRLASTDLRILAREDRLRAYDHAGVPSAMHPSRAMLFRLAEQLDADFLILGRYNFNGQTFTATAQLLDVRAARLSPEISESGPLPQLIMLETNLAWDLLRLKNPALTVSRDAFVAAAAPIRLDALENYTRGILAGTNPEKIKYFREALRINPEYREATLALGRAAFAEKQYDAALAALSRVPPTHPDAGEAEFVSGLCLYYLGQYDKSEAAFRALLNRVQLPEVYNNLGAAQARQGKRSAIDQFRKAQEIDAADSDYRFNAALALLRNGDASGSARNFRDYLASHPNDSEARSAYELASAANPLKAGGTDPRLPQERLKRNYDENSFRQLALQIQAINEQRTAGMTPAEHAKFHVMRGQDLLAQGFTAEAERELAEATQLEPSNAEAHAGLARALEARSDLAGARKEAQAALALHPWADLWLLLARLDLRDNKTQEAADKVEQALQLDSANTAALTMKRTIAAKLAEKAQPLPQP